MKNIGCKVLTLVLVLLLLPVLSSVSYAQDSAKKQEHPKLPPRPKDEETTGSVNVEGHSVDYNAYAGTISLLNGSQDTTARIFYVAYMKSGVKNEYDRPVTFLYNGGPGSSTVWLHMGAFGPRRVGTADTAHTSGAPYKLLNNDYSLLDVSDLVFIDAPATGFSRIIGKGSKKDYYGVNEDANAFAQFITRFLTKYNRWNSPKYLFGESYGTTRSAVLSNILERRKNIDLNGVILLSQILNFSNSIDGPHGDPGEELPYELGLPTFAATAWYHHKLPNEPEKLKPFLNEVEQFAMGPYASALAKGSTLSNQEFNQIADKLHQYTGLPVDYIKKANLRISGGEFEKNLLSSQDETTGRLDTRFSGPTMDPLSEGSEYDPQSAAISSAYVTLFNDYVRNVLHFGKNMTYRPSEYGHWDWKHGSSFSMNVMPDLASAMKYNPKLKVMLNTGYFDLATPFFEGVYELHHLPIPNDLQKNISFAFYHSGHMVYVHPASLKKLHDNVAAFIRSTDNVSE